MSEIFQTGVSCTIAGDGDGDHSAAFELALDAMMVEAAARGAGAQSVALARAVLGALAPWLLAQKKAGRDAEAVVSDVGDSVVSVVGMTAANYADPGHDRLLGLAIMGMCQARLSGPMAPAGRETLQ